MQAGDTIQNYEIVRQIGVGGMGEVWLGRHKLIGREVAIKSLHKQLIQKEAIRQRFKNEAATLARLQHPNVVALLDYHEDEKGVYLIMEYVEGIPLDENIEQKSGPIPEPLLSKLFAQILTGVQYAHDKKIVHRDIKPSNFLLTEANTLKILDFGIAKLLDQSDNKLTKTGTAMGTVLYMSPEQVKGEAIDLRTDIYSLGVTLFQMATGQCPYDKYTTEFHVYDQIVNHPLPTAKSIYPGVSDHIQFLIQRATEKDPVHRFQSSADFLEALGISAEKGARKGPPPPPPPASGPPPAPPVSPPVESQVGKDVTPKEKDTKSPAGKGKPQEVGTNKQTGADPGKTISPKKGTGNPDRKEPKVPKHQGTGGAVPTPVAEPAESGSEEPESPQPPPSNKDSREEKVAAKKPAHSSKKEAANPKGKPGKKKKGLLIALIAILVLGAGATTLFLLNGGESEKEKLYVIASKLNIREEPDDTKKTETSLPFGTEIEVINRPNDQWVEIQHDGKKGFLSTKYLRDWEKFIKMNNIFTNSEGKMLLRESYHKLALESWFMKKGFKVEMDSQDYQTIYGTAKNDAHIWEVHVASPSDALNTAIPSMKLEKSGYGENETKNSVVIVRNKKTPSRRYLVAFKHSESGNNEIGNLDISGMNGYLIAPVNKHNFEFRAENLANKIVINKELQYGKEAILLARSLRGYGGNIVLWTNGNLKMYPLKRHAYNP